MAFFYQEGLSVKIPLNCVKLLCKTGSLSFQMHHWCDLVIIPLRGYLLVSVDMHTQEKTQEHFSSFTQQDAKSIIHMNLQTLLSTTDHPVLNTFILLASSFCAISVCMCLFLCVCRAVCACMCVWWRPVDIVSSRTQSLRKPCLCSPLCISLASLTVRLFVLCEVFTVIFTHSPLITL